MTEPLKHLSQACSGTSPLHGNCVDPTCEDVCHQVCDECGRPCQRRFKITVLGGQVDHKWACAPCYRDWLKRNKKGPRCEGEGCDSSSAYRDPRYSDQYLCVDCHERVGHALGKE